MLECGTVSDSEWASSHFENSLDMLMDLINVM